MGPYKYTLKRIAKRWRFKNVSASMGLGFTIFGSVSPGNIFVLIYTFLSLLWTIDFCYSQLIFFSILLKQVQYYDFNLPIGPFHCAKI